MAKALPAFDEATIEQLVRHRFLSIAGGWRWKYENLARFRPPKEAAGRKLNETLAAISCPTPLAYGSEIWVTLPPLTGSD